MAEVARQDELLTSDSKGFAFTCAPCPDHLPGLMVLGIARHGNPEKGVDRIFVFMQDLKWYEAHRDKDATPCEEDLQTILTVAANSFMERVLNSEAIPEC